MLSKKPISAILGGTLMCASLSSPAMAAFENENTNNNEALLKSESKKMTNQNQIPNPISETVKSMTDKGFKFDKSPEKYSSIKEVRLDLFKNNNLDTALKEGLNFILSDKTTNFIENKSHINSEILQNSLLCESISNTVKYIESSNSEGGKELELLKRLTGIKAIMESDSSISKSNVFFKFISSLRNAYAAKVSRKIAYQILKDSRNKVETTMGSQTSSKEASVSHKTPAGGWNIGISVGVQNNESTSEKSFYKIDNSGNIGVSLGTGLKNFLSADASYNLGFTQSLIFYSLEQFLDTCSKNGKISSVELREPEIKKIINSRKEMQKKEKSILSQMQTSIEWFLKASETVPQNLIFEWPEVTYSSPADVQKSVVQKCEVNAAASCLAAAGASVTTEYQTIDTSMKHSYLNLIEDDCSASNYIKDSDKIASFLKQEKVKKYKEIKDYFESYFKKIITDKNVHKSDVMSILVSNITGDLHRYNTILSILADENSSDEQRDSNKSLKKEIEKKWLGNFSKGRLNMLKTAIAISSYLRDFADNEEEINLFKQLYSEIEHLAKMQVFAKDFSGKRTHFSTSQSSRVRSAEGQFSFDLPVLGTSYINACYSDSKGDAYFDTSKDITVKIQLPMVGDALLGDYSIRNQIKNLLTKLSEKNNYESEMFKKTLTIIDDNFEDVLKEMGVKRLTSIPGVFSTNKYMILNYFLTKTDKTNPNQKTLPLPGCDEVISKDKDCWALKLIKRIDSTVSNLSVGVSNHSSNLSHLIGKTSSIIGSDTLAFITSRYNVFQTGLLESGEDENYLWDSFKENQMKQFKDLFLNISNKNKNVRYELQSIWNQLVNTTKTDKTLTPKQKNEIIKESEISFKEFLENCDKLKDENSEENLKKASESFDKVMHANYKFNFVPEVKRIYSIR